MDENAKCHNSRTDPFLAELSAISAALVMTGGAAAEAAVAWVVFSGVAEAIQ